MFRLAFDSDVIDDIPAGAPIALSYADLVTTAEQLAACRTRWPVFELIDRGLGDPLAAASIWDVESAALEVGQLRARYDEAHARGIKGRTVYASDNQALWEQIEAELHDRNHYRWVATLNGSWRTTIGYHVDLVQFGGVVQTGAHYDASVIWTSSWHPRLPPPGPAAAPVWLHGAQVSASDLATEAAQLARAAADLDKILRSA